MTVIFITVQNSQSFLNHRLLQASQDGKMELVERLLGKKADVNTQDNEGYTPLMLSIMNFHLNTASLLLKNGADPNKRTFGPSDGIELHRYEYSSIHIASMIPDSIYLKEILKYKPNVDIKDGRGETPLDIALSDGNYDNARALLEYGANPNSVDNRGLTPLIHVMQVVAKYPDIEMVEFLLEKGALLVPNPARLTAIDYAETFENPQAYEVANLLRKHFKVK